MSNYRYQLEKHPKKKGICPNCKHKGVFRFYEEIKTGKRLSEKYGICDRKNNCGYYLHPSLENLNNKKMNEINVKNKLPERVVFIEDDIMKKTLKEYEKNTFVIWLQSTFDNETVKTFCQKYYIGTGKNNSTLFWYLDIKSNIRTAKKITYKSDGKRNKEIKPNYIHTQIKKELNENEVYKICFFGEHLINERPNDIICIVESEKTAIIASLYIPKYIWVASGGNNGLTYEKMQILKDRKIILIPDFDDAGRTTYKQKQKYFSSIGFNIQYNDLEPNINTQEDIADFLIKCEIPKEPEVIFQKQSTNNNVIIPKYQPNNNPFRPTNINNIEQTIIEHYLSYRMPYNVDVESEINSLVSGLLNETNIKVEPNIYRDIINKYEMPKYNKITDINSNLIFKSPYYNDKWYTFNKKDKISKWNIEEIELFFQKAKLPPNPIKLNDFEIIVDVKKFIESSLATCKANNGNETFLPYWESLLEFQKYLIN